MVSKSTFIRKKCNTCISNSDFDDDNVDAGNVMTDEHDRTYSQLIQKVYNSAAQQIRMFYR